MTLVFNINASDPASALARSVTVNSPAQKPVFVLGDNPLIQLYISDGAGAYDPSSGAAGYVPWLGIGTPGALPSGGTFYLGVSSATSGTLTNGKRYLISTFNAGDDFTNIGGTNLTGNVFTATGTTPTTWTNGSALVEITSDISCPPSASAIQTALNSTHAIGANGVTVTASSSSSLAFVFDFTAVGTRYLTAGYGSGMTPDSSAIVAQLIAGSATVKERQFLRLVANPAALQTTWTAITDGWSGRLSCATRGLVDLLNGASSQSSRLELQLVDGSGNITTVGQVECVIRNEVVDPAALIPVPLPSYLTAAQTQLGYIGNQYGVTGLTGGGTNLDGLTTGTTANPTIQTNTVVEIDLSGVIYFYKLVTGTDATSSPDIIRPADYDGTTNARVWKLRNALIAPHASTHASGGSDPVTIDESQVTNLVSDLSTLTTSVAAKVPLSGGTMTGQLNFSGTTHAGVKLISLTTTQRDALTPAAGMLIYNSTTARYEKYESATWGALGDGFLGYYRENTSGSGGSPVVSGTDSFAIGSEATASYTKSFAIGRESVASNLQTCAVGYQANASGTKSTAIGYQSNASGLNSLSFQGASCSGGGAVSFSNGTASGSFAFAGPGSANTAGKDYSAALGYASSPVIEGHIAHSGNTSSQHGWIHTTFQTTNATPAEVLFGHATDQRLPLANNKAYRYESVFVFRDTTSGNVTSIKLTGVVKRGANAASTSLIADGKDVEVNEDGSFDASASADTTNGTVKFTVTGHSSHTVNICVTVHLFEIA